MWKIQRHGFCGVGGDNGFLQDGLPSGQRHVSKRSEIMNQVFLFAASLGDGPTFICGDFNSSLSANQAISGDSYRRVG